MTKTAVFRNERDSSKYILHPVDEELNPMQSKIDYINKTGKSLIGWNFYKFV
jgi:hypothetical protein